MEVIVSQTKFSINPYLKGNMPSQCGIVLSFQIKAFRGGGGAELPRTAALHTCVCAQDTAPHLGRPQAVSITPSILHPHPVSLQVTLHTGLPVPEFYASRSAMQ